MSQEFEIIALEDPDYLKRMKAIDHIDDLHILEEIFISDEYLTVRAKAYDRLEELFEHTKKFKKMKELAKETTDFIGWIPFVVNDLTNRTNIEKSIKWTIFRYDDDEKEKNHSIGQVVYAMITPLYFINTKDQIPYYGDYGVYYKYEMVLRILHDLNGKLEYDYIYMKVNNNHQNAHKKFYDKLVYEVD